MGLWEVVRREVGRVVRDASRSTKQAKRGSGERTTPEALRGPDPGTLLTPEDIETATGSRPVGEGDRRSGGMDVDTGYFRVCIWTLADGGQLLVNTTRHSDEGLVLARSRWDDPSWKDVDSEKPLDGVGDRATWYVKKSPKGGTELHVSAMQGMFKSQLVHTSPAGTKDIGPLTDLMRTVLSRLAAA